MRRKITTALISLAMILLGTVALAPPANAASGVSYCFVNEDGTAYANLPATLQLSVVNNDDYHNWYSVAAMNTDARGCGTFAIWGSFVNAYARVYAYTDLHNPGEGALIYWWGFSPVIGLPGDQASFLGTGIIRCQAWSIPCQRP
jgi:hypothetical protein